jgi:hypothetical protein
MRQVIDLNLRIRGATGCIAVPLKGPFIYIDQFDKVLNAEAQAQTWDQFCQDKYLENVFDLKMATNVYQNVNGRPVLCGWITDSSD